MFAPLRPIHICLLLCFLFTTTHARVTYHIGPFDASSFKPSSRPAGEQAQSQSFSPESFEQLSDEQLRAGPYTPDSFLPTQADVNIVAGGDLTVTGSGNIYGALTVDTNKFIVAGDETGNVTTAGSLNVGSTILGHDSLTITGSINMPAATSSIASVITIGGSRFAHAYGTDNTFIGKDAGNFSMSGSNNTAVGANALDANTTGARNTAVGSDALGANTTGKYNVAMGSNALLSQTTAGHYNTAVGYNALQANTGGANVAVGAFALDVNTTATGITAVGYQALKANTTGANNTAVGYATLDANTTGARNTAVGSSALTGAGTADTDNTAVGYNALAVNNGGDYNTAVGSTALDTNNSGDNNTAVGYAALTANTSAGNNTAAGYNALAANTTGAINTAVGSLALDANTTGSNNTALGFNALGANSTGNFNTAVGVGALHANTTSYNTAVGYQALDQNIAALFNTAVGYQALKANTTGTDNTAIGLQALLNNTAGNYNTALGVNALRTNTTSNSNTAVGQAALFNTTGADNTAIGYNAGSALTTGSNNNICIGSVVTGVAGESTNIRIGIPGTHTVCTIGGISGKTSSGGAAVYVNGSGVLGTTTSALRFKENIENMPASYITNLRSLRPVTYTYINDPESGSHYGMIAEEVEPLFPETIAYDAENQPLTIRYEDFIPVLIKAHQSQQAQLDTLDRRIFTQDLHVTSSIVDGGSMTVTGSTTLLGTLTVTGTNAQLDTLTVAGAATFETDTQVKGQFKVGTIATIFGETSNVVLDNTARTALTVTFNTITLPAVATITFVSSTVAYSSKFLFDGGSTITPLYSESTLGTATTITTTSNGAVATFKHSHASVPGGTTTGTLFYEVSGEGVVAVG